MAYNLANVSILVVDQSSFMRHILNEMLTGFGVGNVYAVESGEKALRKFEEVDIDIVICDSMTEPVDGFELTRTIRNNPDLPNRYLPIIFVTGHADMYSVLRARDAGATEFLVKPVAPAVLYERIVYVIEHQRPFIQAGTYFGPDRRRKVTAEFHGIERRGEAMAVDAKGRGLTQDEIEAIFKGRR
jgi:two-component system, chemotaxis family, chemotaxis protein CheY